jgi:hypothetical protein
MVLTKTRFDRPSIEPPESRGYSVISLRFENLRYLPGLGSTVTYRFEPDKGKVTIIKALGSYLSTEYHSQTVTKWKGLRPDTGKNEVTGQPLQIFANVEFETWGRMKPPAPPAAPGPEWQTVTVRGDWPGLLPVIKWLKDRSKVSVIDKTTIDEGAARQPISQGAPDSAATKPDAGDPASDKGIVVDITRTGTDPADMSARAWLRLPAGEQELFLNLEWDRFGKFDPDVHEKWFLLNSAKFRKQIIEILKAVGI